jgi:hypothetical protein
MVKARRSHKCYECGDVINPGDVYERASGLCEGSWWRASVCLACHDIAESLNCDGSREYGSLWERIGDVGAHAFGLGCLAKLSTAVGKAKLQAWVSRELLDGG